nr:MAG TPA: hypothetical protein [Caudoviricetes sp.]
MWILNFFLKSAQDSLLISMKRLLHHLLTS